MVQRKKTASVLLAIVAAIVISACFNTRAQAQQAVRGRAYAGGAVDLEADVPGRAAVDVARVQTHTHPELPHLLRPSASP